MNSASTLPTRKKRCQTNREAVRLHKLAADQGNASGQYSLGWFYLYGHGGLPKDEREAARLFKLAADQGYAKAQCGLGRLYADGRGGLPNNEREAARLYKLAAEQGLKEAQFNLGNLYREGRGGLPKDDREATRLYKLAADQGDADAQAALTKKQGIFSRLFGGGADAGDGWRQKQEEHEQQSATATKPIWEMNQDEFESLPAGLRSKLIREVQQENRAVLAAEIERRIRGLPYEDVHAGLATHAGMYRVAQKTWNCFVSVPRTRGDEPTYTVACNRSPSLG
jgi:hypothetical protein